MKNILYFFILSILLSSCSIIKIADNTEYSAGGEQPTPTKEKNGKCYEFVVVPKDNTKQEIVAIYTGIKMIEGVETRTVADEPPTTKWVKKAADRNCLSSDPNDCLVWCLVEVPGRKEIITVVTDTNKIKDFVLRPLPNVPLTMVERNTKEWIETLCPIEQKDSLYKEVGLLLVKKGYIPKNTNSIEIEDLKSAMRLFQRDFSLPIGGFNVISLKALGLR
jgi:hypothetical protein